MRGAPNIKKQPESSVVKACICWLYRHGCDVIRNNTGTAVRKYVRQSDGKELTYRIRYGKKGSGDIIACSPYGRWIEIETKSEDGTLSDEQLKRQFAIISRGGVYIIARSIDDLECRKEDILASSHKPFSASHPSVLPKRNGWGALRNSYE
jgi:hypothetical protein